jgi:hypothetical protein
MNTIFVLFLIFDCCFPKIEIAINQNHISVFFFWFWKEVK